MRAAYLAVAGRIRQELQELYQVTERVHMIWQQASSSTNDYYIDFADFLEAIAKDPS